MPITFIEREEGYEDWREMYTLGGLHAALRADAITTAEEWYEARKETYSGAEWHGAAARNDWAAFYAEALDQLCDDMAAGTKSGRPWNPADEAISSIWKSCKTDADIQLDKLCRAQEGAE